MSIVLSLIMTFSFVSMVVASPSPGGLLRGVKPDGENSLTQLTDGNDSTSIVLNNNASKTWTLSSPVTIKSYYLNVNKTDSNGLVRLRFYSTSNAFLGEETASTKEISSGFKSTRFVYDGVSKVVLINSNQYNGYSVYEVDISTNAMQDTSPPSVPVGLTAIAGNAQATLSWNTVIDADLVGYRIYQDGTYLYTVNKPSTSYTVTGLINGTTYSFQISSFDGATPFNESEKSVIVSVTPEVPNVPPPDTTPPGPPTNLTGIGGNGSMQLSWTGVTAPDLDGYNVYVNGIKRGGPMIATSFSLNGLTNGQTYSVRVTAVDKTGNESPPVELDITIFADLQVQLVPNGDSILVQITGGQKPYHVDWGLGPEEAMVSPYVIRGLSYETDYTVTVTDAASSVVTKSVNTGKTKGYLPPIVPESDSAMQSLFNLFTVAAIVGLKIIGGAVALGAIMILALWAWRSTKKWLATSKS
jgi:hypothetical protein